jgi:hypothetical protein
MLIGPPRRTSRRICRSRSRLPPRSALCIAGGSSQPSDNTTFWDLTTAAFSGRDARAIPWRPLPDTLAVARTDQKLIRLAEGPDGWLVVLTEALDQR